MTNKNWDNTNKGVLFINDRKNKSSQPDYTGKVDIGGAEHWLSAWTNEIKQGKRAGQKMLSITIGEPVDGVVSGASALDAPSKAAAPAPAEFDANFDDDMPF